jgi:excinuclease ABC subunit C
MVEFFLNRYAAGLYRQAGNIPAGIIICRFARERTILYISDMDGEIGNTEALKEGAKIISEAVSKLPDSPGVYRMLDDHGEALYVGKAISLKKRASAYIKVDKLSVRLQRMVAATASMEFIYTHTEAEAFLLEANLIKKLKPRYNILLRDDKSFPYILLARDHPFPRLLKHRGSKSRKGDYFGPFASSKDVNRTLVTLQKAFMIRNCTNSYFAARVRPCLQYHIKRCTAPCAGYVCEEDYAQQTEEAKQFLSGKSNAIQQKLSARMQKASEEQDYEKAALYRDRLKALSAVQTRQIINVGGVKDADVMALARQGGFSCVQVFFFRSGQNFGNRSYHMKHHYEDAPEEILSSFVAQFYANRPVPPEIILSHMPGERELIEGALGNREERKIKIVSPKRGVRRELVEFVQANAGDALARELAGKETDRTALQRITEIFGLEEIPQRVEVYDNSHISGSNMVGAMVVAGPEGLIKNSYRKFNIRRARASDDYSMMKEVMERRFSRTLKPRTLKQGKNGTSQWPDLILIDGGKGQLSAAMEVFEYLGIADRLNVVAIAKGSERKAGRETFYMRGKGEFCLPPNDPGLFYLQRLRDEAHRFAVGAHRIRRKGDISRSPLDEIAGIGAGRKKALLMHFGSAREVSRAGIKDLEQVKGISRSMAETIYNFFNSS